MDQEQSTTPNTPEEPATDAPAETPAMSPTEQGQSDNNMTFPQAMEVVRRGGRVRRLEWENKDVCVYMNDGRLKIFAEDNAEHDLVVNDGDMQGEDWVEKP